MTTLQQTHPPILVYEIWEYDNVIRGSLIDGFPFWKAIKRYDYHFDLRGEAAHFVLVTNDPSITKGEAISFAKAVHEGRVKRSRVDLTPCNPTRPK